MPKIDESRPFIPVRIAVLTMSDTRTLAEDKSGNTLAGMIGEAGHAVADRAFVKDDVTAIRAKVQGWIDDPMVDVVITTGGTGFTGRDVTPEAVKPLFEKEIDGFSTVFHMISYQKIETSTIQSRACGGVAPRDLYFLPAGFSRGLQGRLERHPASGNSITATVPATSSRSCRAWKSIAAPSSRVTARLPCHADNRQHASSGERP